MLLVKGNQGTLQAAVQQVLAQAFEESPGCGVAERARRIATAKRRGRFTAIPVPQDSEVFRRWPGVNTIGGIYRCREMHGKLEESQMVFISSAGPLHVNCRDFQQERGGCNTPTLK